MPARAHAASPNTAVAHALPRCPDHLSPAAKNEWRRIATPLHRAGVLTVFDRAALAAYCQAYGRWAEAERKLAETPALIKAPSGYPMQSPWLAIANKQLELMNRYMGELGLTPAARRKGSIGETMDPSNQPTMVVIRTVYDAKGNELRRSSTTDADPESEDKTALIADDGV